MWFADQIRLSFGGERAVPAYADLLSQKIKAVQIEETFNLHRHDPKRTTPKMNFPEIGVRQYKPVQSQRLRRAVVQRSYRTG